MPQEEHSLASDPREFFNRKTDGLMACGLSLGLSSNYEKGNINFCSRSPISSEYLPEVYFMMIAAPIKINKNKGRLNGSLEIILLDYCQLKADKDKIIIEHIKKSYKNLKIDG